MRVPAVMAFVGTRREGEAGTVGPLLGRLFQATFSAAKQVRTDTGASDPSWGPLQK